MRSREISSVIIIQNLAQIKALFKDTWETVTGNCDTTVYLGGNEASTHEYISKLLGKATIDKRSSGETRGRQGSSSRNYDVLGRELMTPDEVRMMDRKKCLVIINGIPPVMDDKFVPFGHPMFDQTADGAGEPYVHGLPDAGQGAEPPFVLLSSEALQYYEKQKEKGEPVYIDSLSYEEFKLLGQADMDKRFVELDEQEQKDRYNEEQARELEYQTQMEAYAEGSETEETMPEEQVSQPEDSIQNRMFRMHFTKEQLNEVQRAMLVRVPKDVILSYFYPETPVTKMMEIRRQYE